MNAELLLTTVTHNEGPHMSGHSTFSEARILSPTHSTPYICALAGLVCLALMLAAPAAQAAGPVAATFAYEHDPLPRAGWWTECRFADGSGVRLAERCYHGDCFNAADLVLERFDASGALIGEPAAVTQRRAAQKGYRVQCHDSGWMVAQWRQRSDGCYHHRIFAPTATATTGPLLTMNQAKDDCRTRASLDVGSDGGFLAVWQAPTGAYRNAIVARRYGSDGESVGELVEISSDSDGRNRASKVSVAADGIALAVWIQDATGPGHIMARFLDSSLGLIGDPFRVDDFAFGNNTDPLIRWTPERGFLVGWVNPVFGGRVARRVATDAAGAVDSPGSAVTPSFADFGATRTVDSVLREPGTPNDLQATAEDPGVWTISHSANQAIRSTDDGATWHVAGAPQLFPGCEDCSGLPGTAFTSEGGTRVAAWVEQDGTIGVGRSPDAGMSWMPAGTASLASDDVRDIRVVAGANTTWVLVWMDESLHWARSTDDGQTWSAAETLVEGVICTKCKRDRHYTRIGLATDGDGAWGLAFSSGAYNASELGFDGDIFLLRSSDNASTWSAPVALGSHGITDGARDSDPSLAIDATGRWIAAWSTHMPVPGADDLEKDVVVSTSTNGGVTWSPPRTLADGASGDTASDGAASLAAGGGGELLASWVSVALVAGPHGLVEARIHAAFADPRCGNTVVETGEECEDGNRNDGDGCDSNCARSCGNGILNDGEGCDDGNQRPDDACTLGCAQAVCGDGVLFTGVEDCDDGNDSDSDDCPSGCRFPRCGDGFLHEATESCDDGNGSDNDGCLSTCVPNVCGDGVRNAGVEVCDDGNVSDFDRCPSDCGIGVCGDGFTSMGIEPCDYADPLYARICESDCTIKDRCGDFNADGAISATDARGILKDAVGLSAYCTTTSCDLDGNGRIQSSDALLALRSSVGQQVGLRCSIGTGPIVFWIDDSRDMQALQFIVHYGPTGGNFSGHGAAVECKALQPSLFAANDNEDKEFLVMGFVTNKTLGGKRDLARCNFELPAGFNGQGFTFRIDDVSDADSTRLIPEPRLGYRLEPVLAP